MNFLNNIFLSHVRCKSHLMNDEYYIVIYNWNIVTKMRVILSIR